MLLTLWYFKNKQWFQDIIHFLKALFIPHTLVWSLLPLLPGFQGTSFSLLHSEIGNWLQTINQMHPILDSTHHLQSWRRAGSAHLVIIGQRLIMNKIDVLLDHLGNQLLGHLHDYDGLLPSRWPFPPPPFTWCAPWPARQAPPTWCAPWPPCQAPSTWCAPWPPPQAPSPSHPWCPPWAVSQKNQEKCARKRKTNWGWQLSSWQM